MRLYIIRHGVTAWNKAKRMQGQTDIPLAEEGIELALRTGEGMADVPIDVVISSPLTRALETAKCVLRGRALSGSKGNGNIPDIPIITDDRIQEISFGEWEGECVLDSKVLPEDHMERFFHDPLNIPQFPGGETFSQVRERTGLFLRELSARSDYAEKNILISTHGAAGRCLLSHFFEDGETNIWRTGVPANCSVSIVDIRDGNGTVVELDKIYAPSI
ncbi:MAG: histidine phosphatase family protein [Lachnospiraceae bacterium]|nr:histidine phosphatase family protein [Lachnospiraceae bacterium]